MAQKKLHPGSKWLFRFNAFWVFLFSILVGGAVAVGAAEESSGFSLSNSVLLALFSILVIFICIIEVYARLSYRFWAYEFTDSQLRIERGIIWKKYSNIPYERIQNVDITRGIIARLCKFSTVNIQTAGFSTPMNNRYGAYSEGFIPAVPVNEAEKIREFVIKKITKKGRRQGL